MEEAMSKAINHYWSSLPGSFSLTDCHRYDEKMKRLDSTEVATPETTAAHQLSAVLPSLCHWGFLESALLFQCTVFFVTTWMLCLTQQLPADSVSACICILACRSMQWGSPLAAVEWGKAFKWSHEFCRPALSRKPLWFVQSSWCEPLCHVLENVDVLDRQTMGNVRYWWLFDKVVLGIRSNQTKDWGSKSRSIRRVASTQMVWSTTSIFPFMSIK